MAQQCRLALFQHSDFAGDLEDSKSTSWRVLCIFGSRTFVPISWMCKKQTSVSHRSIESEIISWMLDCEWILDLGDIVIEVLRSTNNTARQSKLAQGNLVQDGKTKTSAEMERARIRSIVKRGLRTHTHILLKVSLSSTFVKTMKLSSR